MIAIRMVSEAKREKGLSVALCFSGEIRSLDACYPSIQRHVIDKIPPCTVFLHTYRTEDTPKASVLNCEQMLVERQPVFDEKNYNERLGPGQKTGVRGILSQLYGVQRCNELKKRYEETHGMLFDWVIRIRPDSCFLSNFPDLTTLDNNCLYIPNLRGYGGYFDHLAFGGSAVMDVYCNRLDELDAYYQSGHVMHPETFLKDYLDAKGITVKRPEIVQCLLRTPGHEDRSHGVVFCA